MAIYHLRATMISRSTGRSATGAAAYRSAERIVDQRTGLTFDYLARGGVDHTEILAPAEAPDWVRDRAALWNAVELAETRKNSQVAREIRVALPAELDAAARADLVRGFCQRQFVDRGMVADIALHAPGAAGDERNHHAHILLTTREIGPEGFTTKNRDWNAVAVLEGWREAWARDSNHALERSGIEDRVDHRTLVAQRDAALERAEVARERGDEAVELAEAVRAAALDRPPLPQLSLGAWQLKERGIEVAAVRVWQEVRERAAEVARVADRLSDNLRDWTRRALERVTAPEQGLAARMREAWEARQSRMEGQEVAVPDREASQSLAERLRAAAQGIDREALAERASALQQGREDEERQRAQEAAQIKERERVQQLEREEQQRVRDRGLDYGI